MGIVIKNSAINTFLSYIGVVIGYINIAYFFPKFFPPEELGLRSVLVEFSLLFSQISMVGFMGVIIRFFPYFRNDANKHNGFLFLVINVPTFFFCVFAVFFLFFKDYILSGYDKNTPDVLLLKYGWLIVPIGFCMLITNLLEAYLTNFFKNIFSNFLKDVFVRLATVVLLVLFIYHFLTITLFWYGFTFIYILCLLLLIVYIKRIGQLHFKPDFSFITKEHIKDISLYAVFSWLGVAGSLIVLKVDIVMLTNMTSLKNVGVYSLAVYITVIIDLSRRLISQSVLPLLTEASKNNDFKQIDSIYKKTSVNQLIIALTLFLLLWVNIDDIFSFIPNSAIYINGKYVVLFLGLAKVFDMATGINSEIINYSKYYKVGLLLLFLLALLNVILNYVFIPIYGITGAAIATMLSIIFYNIVKFLFIKSKFKLQPFTTSILKIIGLGIIAWALCSIIPFLFHPFINIIIKSVIVGITFILPILMLNISSELSPIFYKIVETAKTKLKK